MYQNFLVLIAQVSGLDSFYASEEDGCKILSNKTAWH